MRNGGSEERHPGIRCGPLWAGALGEGRVERAGPETGGPFGHDCPRHRAGRLNKMASDSARYSGAPGTGTSAAPRA